MHRLLPATLALLASTLPLGAACCYFSAKDQDILQPAQKVFITWDPVKKAETFTVQPKFEGNAKDFGMVIPTPGKPKLDEMPRDFFKELAVFTILEPVDKNKYDLERFYRSLSKGNGSGGSSPSESAIKSSASGVVVLESGIVGSLEYKIITAKEADDLYVWLKDNKYNYSGDEATLDFYVKKEWFFTVMKIDTAQMKKGNDGAYQGEVTPTHFAFESDKLVYPLKITQLSVKDHTEVLLYIQAPHKVDLPDHFSYQVGFVPMWSQATDFAFADKLSKDEVEWQKHVKDLVPDLTKKYKQWGYKVSARLEWCKKITDDDIEVLEGKKKFSRNAPKEDIDNLKLLKGHVTKGQYITKIRKVFRRGEMDDDLDIVCAAVADKDDVIEYFSALPTSPP